jgi:hypothetical protein
MPRNGDRPSVRTPQARDETIGLARQLIAFVCQYRRRFEVQRLAHVIALAPAVERNPLSGESGASSDGAT